MRKALFLFVTLLILIASCTKKSTPVKETPIDSAMVFSNNCARCHGSDGTNGKAPNLAKTDLNKKEINDIITKGEGRMPHFDDKLTTKEIAAITDFVVALKK